MATTYTVRPNQSICDVIIQTTGSLEAGMQFCRDNNVSITAIPVVGTVYQVSDAARSLQDSGVLQQFDQMGTVIGTLDAPPPPPTPSGVYHRSLTVTHTLCGASDSHDFPVLVSISDDTLKTVANGGHVNRSDGSDILFFKDAGGLSMLNWEVEYYDGVSGTLIAWVRLSTVSSSFDTVFYMRYGETSITSFMGGSAGSAWNSFYKAVYHFSSSLTTDATNNGSTLTNSNLVTQVNGRYGSGAAFSSASFQSLTCDSPAGFPVGAGERTMTCWFKMGANQSQEFLGYGDNVGIGTYTRFAFYYTGANMLSVEVSGAGSSFSWTYDTNWHKITAVLAVGANNLNQVLIYFDGVLQTVVSSSAVLVTTNTQLALGRVPEYLLDTFYTGILDEVRIMKTGISADWEITEYHNQSNPGNIGAGGFITYSSEY